MPAVNYLQYQDDDGDWYTVVDQRDIEDGLSAFRRAELRLQARAAGASGETALGRSAHRCCGKDRGERRASCGPLTPL